MSKAGKNRHSGSTRTPPMIEHEPLKKENSDAKANAAHEATIAPEVNTKAVEAPNKIVKSDAKKTNEKKAESPKIEDQNTGDPKKTENAFKVESFDTGDTNTPKGKKGSAFIAGLTGGVAALILGGGLQWIGLLPIPSNSTDTAALEQQINELRADMVTPNNAQDFGKNITKAEEAATKALQQAENNRNELDILKTSFTNLGAQNGDATATLALSEQITRLEDKAALINSLNQRLTETQGALNQTRSRLIAMEEGIASAKNMSENIGTLETETQKVRLDMTALSQQVKILEDRPLPTPTKPDDRTELIAANALKAAVDRGGSYITELQNFENVIRIDIALEPLKKYVHTGLPSAAEMSHRFTKIADAIAATDNKVAPNASFADKLWAHARGLIISRPVGNVEGTTASAIAARMEVAIEKGDYDNALHEWQALSDQAKTVSANFVDIIIARRDVNQLLNQLVIKPGQSQTPTNSQ